MEEKIKQVLKNLKQNESTISMILGGLVVMVITILLINYFRNGSLPQITDQSTSTKAGELANVSEPGERFEGSLSRGQTPPSVEEETGPYEGSLPTGHIVKAGEDLWTIAEQYYGSGYNWVDIAKANAIEQPDFLAIGRRLTIPGVQIRQPVVTEPEQPAVRIENVIEGNEYTVQPKDSLWDIAVRAYRDGYQWTRIYQENIRVLSNPDLIEVGQSLIIPR